MPSDISKIDGSLDFSGGVDSNSVTTLQSQLNPHGLARNMLAWLVNGTIRNGGIEPRPGWNDLGTVIETPYLYQGGMTYDPPGLEPQLIFLMGGHVYLIEDVDNPGSVRDLSVQFGLVHPADQPQAYFVQAEEFVVIQAGDYQTLPLIWDGATLRRSSGLPGSEIPAAGPMDYYMGRLWYGQYRSYAAGDIVGSHASGTPAYGWRDSVLKVTENPLALGGDNFTLPSDAGNIRALAHSANLNSLLGQGQLYIFTRKAIYTLQVPVSRTDWINAGNDGTAAGQNGMPLQFAVQLSNGSVNDRSIVKVNGDLFFQSLEPSVRSLTAAVRNFQQWGDTPVSINVDRILGFNNRALLWASSGIYFDNRLIQTAMPEQTEFGVIHKSLLPLNFDPLSTLQEKLPPAWEGQYVGLDHFQLFTGDFGGLERAFSLALSRRTQSLELWELTNSQRTENGDNRIDWIVEFPAYTHGKEFQLKEALCLELWLDDVHGTVDFSLDYRPDSEACWYPWKKWQVCWARNGNEYSLADPSPYPTACGPGHESTITLPRPPQACNRSTGRIARIGYQFQPRLIVHGWCRIRGIYLHCAERDRMLYDRMVCRGIAGTGLGRTGTESATTPLPPAPPTPQPITPEVKGLQGAFGDYIQDAGGEQIFGAAGD